MDDPLKDNTLWQLIMKILPLKMAHEIVYGPPTAVEVAESIAIANRVRAKLNARKGEQDAR
jgi:hypothetical protein